MKPMKPISIVAAAKRLIRLAERIEELARDGADTAQLKRALTLNIHAASRAAQELSERYRAGIGK